MIYRINEIRTLLFSLYGNLGMLSVQMKDLKCTEESLLMKRKHLLEHGVVKNVYNDIISLAKEMGINLIVACDCKMKLNEQKYPVKEVKVSEPHMALSLYCNDNDYSFNNRCCLFTRVQFRSILNTVK